MPGMDGLAVCRRLKADPATRAIPVIFLTVADDLDERLQGFALGAVDYIGKPFHEEEVLARLAVHLAPRPASTAASREEPTPVAADAVLVQAAKAILAERLADPPTLEDLAHLVGSNRRRLNDALTSSITSAASPVANRSHPRRSTGPVSSSTSASRAGCRRRATAMPSR